MNKNITVTRKTTESLIKVALDFNGLTPDYRKKIKTPIMFLNHMIEHIAYRGGFNIETEMQLAEFYLTHVVCEDLGQALGKGVLEYVKNNSGVMGFGDGVGIIDEAYANCAISFEGRVYIDINYNNISIPQSTEDMLSEDLETFLEGFVNGAQCTLHINLLKGKNAHHIFEAIFRAVGSSLNNALKISPQRQGFTSGVAGMTEWMVELD